MESPGVHRSRMNAGRDTACRGLPNPPPVLSNKSFDADTQRHCAARRVGERTPCGAMPLRAGQLRR